jgi:superfamily I DNA/RNA helicase
MPRFRSEKDWTPVGVDELEPNAYIAVQSLGNTLVVAGPGAGKTELLAQRASFLLETGRCPPPKRILAISFKRDAAKNIGDRVQRRCHQWADRFDSFTLDAFAKSLVDRFLTALPGDWRPRPGYQVRTAQVPVEEARQWLSTVSLPTGIARIEAERWTQEQVRRALDQAMHGVELPYENPALHPLIRAWGLQWWNEQILLPESIASLTFPMLNRLAAHLLRCNPKVLAALQATYQYVFLDEFQDTTESQWDLIRSGFRESTTTMTAVGDTKQRIMVWAGAKPDVFEKFGTEFVAQRIELVRNYRSHPELVRMQHVIAKSLEAGSVEQVSAAATGGTGLCEILEFQNPEQEAAYLAELLHSEFSSQGSAPHEYCVLARQRVSAMIASLQQALQRKEICLRDESNLQDLRAEPISKVVMAALRLSTRERDSQAWISLAEEVSLLSGSDLELDELAIERIATIHKTVVSKHLASRLELKGLPSRLMAVLGANRYRATYRQYTNGDYLERTLEGLGIALQTSLANVGHSSRVPDDFAGVNVLPAMTIHKSKGLEFRTVIFLGLEDSQWWGFRNQPEEEKRAFFVAFSRAKEKVLFTWSDERDGRFGRQRQLRNDVDALHSILGQAGVRTVDCRSWQIDGRDPREFRIS